MQAVGVMGASTLQPFYPLTRRQRPMATKTAGEWHGDVDGSRKTASTPQQQGTVFAKLPFQEALCARDGFRAQSGERIRCVVDRRPPFSSPCAMIGLDSWIGLCLCNASLALPLVPGNRNSGTDRSWLHGHCRRSFYRYGGWPEPAWLAAPRFQRL